MEISEAQQAKEKLENSISELIANFEKETGLEVGEIIHKVPNPHVVGFIPIREVEIEVCL